MKIKHRPSHDDISQAGEIEIIPHHASSDRTCEHSEGTETPASTEDSAADAAQEKKASPWWKWLVPITVVAIIFIVGFALIEIGKASSGGSAQVEATRKEILPHVEPVSEDSAAKPAEASKHVHDWIPIVEIIHHEAKTHTVDHPAEYKKETTYHTVCNTCMEVIDGKVPEHETKTAHKTWTTNVPIENQTVAKEAWVETITDEAARDELVTVAEECSLCKEYRPQPTTTTP